LAAVVLYWTRFSARALPDSPGSQLGETQANSRSGTKVRTMGKGNNSQSKEKKKPKKAPAPKAVPVKAATPPPKKP
jgi:hypothetical protein